MNVNERVYFLKRTVQGAGLPVAMGLCAFLLYALTGARTIQWQDSAQFTYRITSGTLWNEYGLAMVHPLHFWLGRLMLWAFPGPDHLGTGGAGAKTAECEGGGGKMFRPGGVGANLVRSL